MRIDCPCPHSGTCVVWGVGWWWGGGGGGGGGGAYHIGLVDVGI